MKTMEEKSDLGLYYSKTCLKRPLKRKTKTIFQDRLSLNAGQKYCRMLPLEHSAILSTFIKLTFAIKTFFCLFLSDCLKQVLLYLPFQHYILKKPITSSNLFAQTL